MIGEPKNKTEDEEMALALKLSMLPSPTGSPTLNTTTKITITKPFFFHLDSTFITRTTENHNTPYTRNQRLSFLLPIPYRLSTADFESVDDDDDDDGDDDDCSFDGAVALFNQREYYKCHDFLEALWNNSQDPTRTLVHGILQCAVGFHHLFSQNHRGAMMELGEGLCKLKKMNFESGPFHQFEHEISAVLDFIYQTQIELAACSEDLCLTMDQSERSYQLLGGYGAGQQLYHLENESNDDDTYIVFSPPASHASHSHHSPRVKLPILDATQEHLLVMSV